jgi:cytoskeleton protein RodZ
MSVDVAATPADLIAFREARGVSPEDLHRQIKIHIDQVHALERGDWAALPGLPFVRGALRSYGRALGIDVGPLLAGIGGASMPTDLKRASSLTQPIRRGGMLGFGNGGSGSSITWVILSVVALAAIALFFGRQQEPGELPSWLSKRAAPPQSSTDQPPVVPPVVVAAASAAGASVEIGVKASATPYSAEQIAITITPADGQEQAEVPLQLTFLADTQISLSQADGRDLLSGPQRADSTSNLRVKGPITLVLPRYAAVKLRYDGKPVAIDLPAGNTSFRAILK